MIAVYLYDEGIKNTVKFTKLKKFIKANFGKIKIKLINLKKGIVKTNGLIFDLMNTANTFRAYSYSKKSDACHIILTNKLFATIDDDKRPHIRASICSVPSIISIPGIVEGPAKPKEYYLYKQKYTQLGIWEKEEPNIKKAFKGRFIDYEDKRLMEVIKGYIAQAIFFYITGEPFCENKNCRLYNAHWQEDLIYAQIKKGTFCKMHKEFLKKLK